jgi:hypothetical protein
MLQNDDYESPAASPISLGILYRTEEWFDTQDGASVTNTASEPKDSTSNRNDSAYMTSDHLNAKASHLSFWQRLSPVIFPFWLAACLTLAVLMVPLSKKADSYGNSTKTNFWLYSLLQQGLWSFGVAMCDERLFHAGLSELAVGKNMPRAKVIAAAWMTSPILWLFAAATHQEKSPTTALIGATLPAVVIIVLYFALAQANVREPMSIVHFRVILDDNYSYRPK